MKKVYDNILEASLLPKIICIRKNLFLACFDLMKIMPAQHILNCAEDSNQIGPGSIIIETSSGTFGLALAMLCCNRKYKLILVSDPIVDKRLKQRMEDLGASVHIVPVPPDGAGIQNARLDKLSELMQKYPEHFHPNQYSNDKNPESYSLLAGYLVENIGQFDTLVGAVGSGGSMCGTTNFLRSIFPELIAVGVDTFNSVLFGLNDGPRLLRGLGNSLKVPNVDHSQFDQIHWIGAAPAFYSTRRLHSTYGIYMGPTSGASFAVAERIAEKNPDKKIVCICADSGHRYSDNVYNNNWLKKNSLLLTAPVLSPIEVSHPSKVMEPWSFINWNRRSYQEILGYPYLDRGVL